MRLCERTLTDAELAPRIREAGELGGIAECFSPERIPIRASCLPEEGGVSPKERGTVNREKLRLLVPGDTPANPGDGIWMDERMWRIASVQKWTAHLELVCEAV